MLLSHWLTLLPDIATPIGVGFAGYQLWLTQRQAQTAFEDQLSSQYREIVRGLPIEALLGKDLPDDEIRSALPGFLHYFDLCNEQLYLKRKKRISKTTWKEWEEGIQQNLARPAFAKAWQIIATRSPDLFDELRSLVPPKPVTV